MSRTPYTNVRYTHSGWPSEDQQFLFVQDELDERDNGLSTTLRVFSIADLTAPTLVGTWTGPTGAIDHNGFARGNRYYMSNYTRGLTILDITDPTTPSEAGRFDTYPSSDGTGFPGNWGVFPFLPSGNVALSDIDSGLYMVADKTLDVAEGSFSFTSTAYAGDETQTIDLVVQRNGGTQGNVSVNWSALGATAALTDITTTSGVLNWGAGDASSRTISLTLDNDGIAEGMEQLLIKLTAPAGGATIGAPGMASAYISDPGASAVLQFAAPSLDISERGFGTAVAILYRSGSAQGTTSVDYSITSSDATNGSDYTGPMSGTITWDDGDAAPKWIEYTITDDGTGEGTEFFELTLGNASNATVGSNAALRINIIDGTGTNSAPNAIAGASRTVAAGTNVVLDGSASNDPDGNALTYAWAQTLGPTVALSNPNSASASFSAPSSTSDTLYRFELTVTDTGSLTDTAETSITVTGSGSGVGPGSSGGGGGGTLGLFALLALLSLSAISRRGAV